MSDPAPSRILLLVGPTASGKSSVAHQLASTSLPGSILSADAMMIYRDMSIGTAKPSRTEIARHHYCGLDLADPGEPFSVHDYLKAVRHRGPWRMVVGGTGLYFRGLLKGLDAGGGEDDSLRREAESVFAGGGLPGLKQWCRERVPEIDDRLPAGDRENPRRWIRAVERQAATTPGVPPVLDPAACVIVGIARDRMDLEQRIRDRVRAMYRDGLVDEARQLRAKHQQLSNTARHAIGYAEAYDVVDGKISIEDAMERTVVRTRQYAKRQMTWFRNQLTVRWISAAPGASSEKLAAEVMDVFGE